jgi:hypothetical protein
MTTLELIDALRDLEARGFGHLDVLSDTLNGTLATVEVASLGYDGVGAPCIILNDTAIYPGATVQVAAH